MSLCCEVSVVTTSSDIVGYVYQIGFGSDLLGVPLVMPVLHPTVGQSFQELRVMESYSSGHWQQRGRIWITDKFRAIKGNGKVHPCTGRTAHRRSRGIHIPFHDHGTRRGWGVSVHALAALYPWERPGTQCTGGWVGPRAGLDRCRKSRPHRDSIPRPSSP
jgi:hypothetical protein